MAEAFEHAVEAVVDGDESHLQALLHGQPHLATARSRREHRGTLLHYVAANGVEGERQRTPPNAVAIAELLLGHGADIHATAEFYGGGPGSTALVGLVTSVHPHRAGVQSDLVHSFCGHGNANGLDDDGLPLMAAIGFRYPRAAEALAGCGARVDNLIAAAALGRLDAVEAFRNGRGWRLTAAWHGDQMWHGRAADPHRAAGLALAYAALFGRWPVVDYLLDHGADIATPTDQGFTALHWAAWYGDVEAVAQLVARGAPLEALNDYGGTVLDGTVWGAANAGCDPHRTAAIVEQLIAAGADRRKVTPFPSGCEPVDEVLRRHGR